MKFACLMLAAGLSLSALAQAPEQKTALPAPLGKLFLTPEKRLSLERQRQYNLVDGDGPESDTLRLDGVVQRSSGYNSIWINQHMQSQARGSGNTKQSAASSPVELEEGKEVRLQVGESVNRSTQERKNVLPPKAIQSTTRH